VQRRRQRVLLLLLLFQDLQSKNLVPRLQLADM
jgi:hypothetical protein